jgi:hypothetical protein
MPQITITVDIDEEVGDVQIDIDEIHADGLSMYFGQEHEDRTVEE